MSSACAGSSPTRRATSPTAGSSTTTPGTLVEFWVEDRPGGVTLKVVESGLAGLGKDADALRQHYEGNSEGWEKELEAARRFVAGVDRMTGATPELTPVFAALGDDTRWAILARLGEAPASASALARELPISRQAIVKHLERARRRWVWSSRSGEAASSSTARSGGRLSDVARELERIGRTWDNRLARIKRLAEDG